MMTGLDTGRAHEKSSLYPTLWQAFYLGLDFAQITVSSYKKRAAIFAKTAVAGSLTCVDASKELCLFAKDPYATRCTCP